MVFGDDDELENHDVENDDDDDNEDDDDNDNDDNDNDDDAGEGPLPEPAGGEAGDHREDLQAPHAGTCSRLNLFKYVQYFDQCGRSGSVLDPHM